jgi:hypothetical protein
MNLPVFDAPLQKREPPEQRQRRGRDQKPARTLTHNDALCHEYTSPPVKSGLQDEYRIPDSLNPFITDSWQTWDFIIFRGKL